MKLAIDNIITILETSINYSQINTDKPAFLWVAEDWLCISNEADYLNDMQRELLNTSISYFAKRSKAAELIFAAKLPQSKKDLPENTFCDFVANDEDSIYVFKIFETNNQRTTTCFTQIVKNNDGHVSLKLIHTTEAVPSQLGEQLQNMKDISEIPMPLRKTLEDFFQEHYASDKSVIPPTIQLH